MLSEQNINKTKETYKKIFSEYASSNKNLRPVIKKMLDFFISKLAGKLVVDIGCASGVESEYMLKHGLKVTGLDSSQEFIDLAKKKCPECDFVLGDMRSLNFSKDSFDGVWVSASFLHIPKFDAEKTVSGFERILKPDGILYISVRQGNFDDLRENSQMKWPERHFSDYQMPELVALIEQTGLRVFKKQSVKTDWGPTFLHIFAIKTD